MVAPFRRHPVRSKRRADMHGARLESSPAWSVGIPFGLPDSLDEANARLASRGDIRCRAYTNPSSTSVLPSAVISCRWPDPPATRLQLSDTSTAAAPSLRSA